MSILRRLPAKMRKRLLLFLYDLVFYSFLVLGRNLFLMLMGIGTWGSPFIGSLAFL